MIPTWNRAALVVGALEYLTVGPLPPWAELIVVDDGSTDETVSLVRRRFPGVHVIGRATNGGFGAAVNTGFQAARGEYLATVNNDALVSWANLEQLVRFLEATPRAAAASPRIKNAEGHWQQTGFAFPRGPWGWFRNRVARRQAEGALRATSQEPERADYLRGACLVFRRAALQEVGLFDEQFFMFAEEIDLFRRLAAAGWSAWVVPGASAEHSGGKSSRAHEDLAISSRFRRLSYRSLSVYYRKHHGWPASALLRAVLAVRVTGRLARSLVRSPFVPSERWWVREHAGCLLNVVRPCQSHPRVPPLGTRESLQPSADAKDLPA